MLAAPTLATTASMPIAPATSTVRFDPGAED
jgi:hypothetical protein